MNGKERYGDKYKWLVAQGIILSDEEETEGKTEEEIKRKERKESLKRETVRAINIIRNNLKPPVEIARWLDLERRKFYRD